VPIHDLGPELCDWGATVATLVELDLMIAVDCSVAHLAGALGRPVWICLPPVPEWRWMLERADTPWYESARLFRQPRAMDWSSDAEGFHVELELTPKRGRG
jgi:ADP-heptose:LPS heptosyltransferase